ncbi:MAG TPA: LysE family transporter [Sporichthyaceae bacterium]|nr:LysE family transporter [Sporichthyaceae bacterium]
MLHSNSFATGIAGLVFGLSLIVAIGPQNLHVLRQGLLRRHVLLVVSLCSVSELVLTVAGVAAGGAVLGDRRWLLTAVRLGAAAFLLGCAVAAARRAARPAAVSTAGCLPASSRRAIVAATLTFTWLNPGVYLDTLVVLGSVANAQTGGRWWFAAGAGAGGVVWFLLLGFGARLLAGVFAHHRSWQALDVLVALVLTTTGMRLLAG